MGRPRAGGAGRVPRAATAPSPRVGGGGRRRPRRAAERHHPGGADRRPPQRHRLRPDARPGPPWDVLVNPDLGRQTALDLAAVDALPQVEASSGVDGFFAGGQRQLRRRRRGPGVDRCQRSRGRFRPQLVEGRLPDLSRPDQVLVNRTYARQHHVGPGSTMSLTLVERRRRDQGGPGAPGRRHRHGHRDRGTARRGRPGRRRAPTVGCSDTGVRRRPPRVGSSISARSSGCATASPTCRRSAAAVEKMVPSETIVFQTQANTTAAVRRAVRPETVALVALGVCRAQRPRW